MKKRMRREVEVEVVICNICGEEFDGKDPWKPERIQIVRTLFKTADFHAHEKCLNKVIKGAFSKYFNPTS